MVTASCRNFQDPFGLEIANVPFEAQVVAVMLPSFTA
jgi:hypothetical protein